MSDSDPISSRSIVTGGTGFIGSHLCRALSRLPGSKVTALIRGPVRGRSLRALGVSTLSVGLRDRSRLSEALDGADLVFHLAHDFRATAEENLRVFMTLADASEIAGVRRLVFVSSIAVYDGWPGAHLSEISPASLSGNEYKLAKRSIELDLVRRSRAGTIEGVVLQPTIVYGRGSWMWTDSVARRLMKGRIVMPAESEGVCHAVHVSDVIEAIASAAESGSPGARYIISGEERVSWHEYLTAHKRGLGVGDIQMAPLASLESRFAEGAGASSAPGHTRRKAMAVGRKAMGVGEGLAARADQLLGGRRSRRLREYLGGFRGGRPAIHYPTRSELALYKAAGSCSIELAQKELGYEPKVDFSDWIRGDGADYLRELRDEYRGRPRNG